ncbi:nuclear factor related to kappa-B-binding protein isoform X2 [Sabethes cyaneus]|uniref:nuclear factor related to kappa-B-binding protein isoform X2 n=1 Tax=Sabethes cyaneus TaxID=53552 RepID=UPI00237E355C|nr:nuclear factor related to kappa-B-binding protein isoform X2 [Sabethes cyaneus]
MQHHPELDCQEIKLKDVVFRTQTSSGYRRILPISKAAVADGTAILKQKHCNWIDSSGSLLIHATPNTQPIIQQLMNAEAMQSTSDELSDDSMNIKENCSFDINGENIHIDQSSEHTQTITTNNTQSILNEHRLDTPSESNSLEDLSIRDANFLETGRKNTKFAEQFSTLSSNKPKYANAIQYVDDEDDNKWSCKKDEKYRVNKLHQECDEECTTRTYETLFDKAMLQLVSETHKCFLSLIRDMFYSTSDHRLTIDELKVKLDMWVNTPKSMMNDWYNMANNNWTDMLQSAIHFLSGEFTDQPDDFVPYIEYKVQLNIYQWIGASRDSDYRLLDLCNYWLTRRHEMGLKGQSNPPRIASKQRYSGSNSNSFIDDDDGLSERTISPPPPRFPTDWSVRKATEEEIKLFRDQEKSRYENPHMAFTYKQHSYYSVVGPVKGIYTQAPGISKARGHNMLASDRPNFVTILTLVRDATARLPNGEGTRSDICELLKSSQYISPTATDQVLQTIVSGALDRMHTEHDPCVKYDTKRKIWIYLHRNRTEAEFERRHHQYQGIAKHKKSCPRKKITDLSIDTGKSISESNLKSNSQSSLESEDVNSDSTVECSYISQNSVSELRNNSIQIPSNNPLPFYRDCEEFQPEKNDIVDSFRIQDTDGNNPNIITHSTPIIITSQKDPKTSRDESPPKVQIVQLDTPQTVTKSDIIEQNNIADMIKTDEKPSLLNAKKILPIVKKQSEEHTAKTITADNFCSISITKSSEESQQGSNVITIGKTVEAECITPGFTVPPTLNSGNIQQEQSKLKSPTAQLKTPKHVPVLISGQTIPTQEIEKNTSLFQARKTVTFLPSCTSNICVVQPDPMLVAAKTSAADISTSTSETANQFWELTSSLDVSNTITFHKGQQSILTPAQQKQILENLLVQQNKQPSMPKTTGVHHTNVGNTFPVNSNTCNNFNFQSRTQSKTILNKVHKSPVVTLSNISPAASASYQTAVTTNLKSSATHLSTADSKQAATDIQVETNIGIVNELSQSKIHSKQQTPVSPQVLLNTTNNDICTVRRTTTTNILQTESPGTRISGTVKSASSICQPTSSCKSLNDAFRIAQRANRMTTKGVTNNEDCLPRQNKTNTTVRCIDNKSSNTKLVQLADHSSVLPIAQYAVVAQNTNVLTASQNVTQCSMKQTVTTANKFTDLVSGKVIPPNHISKNIGNDILIGIQPSCDETAIKSFSQTIDSQQPVKTQHSPNIQQVFTKIVRATKSQSSTLQSGASFINTPSLKFASIGGSPVIITSKTNCSEDVHQSTSSIVFQNSTESSNITYGGKAVKVQGSVISRDTNVVGSQTANNTVCQKILLGNPLLRVRTVPRQPSHMQFSFAQSSISNGGTTTASTNIPSSISNINVESSQYSDIASNQSQLSIGSTSMKMVPKVGVRLNQQTQRLILSTQSGQLVTQQILMPSGFQAGSFNIKRLKVIPVNNQPKGMIIRAPCTATSSKSTVSSVSTFATNKVTAPIVKNHSKLLRISSNVINKQDQSESNAEHTEK